MAYFLVIDDEEAICWGFSRLAEDMGHEVASAASAERGIELARERRPDLIILDIRLPGMSGLEAMHTLQEVARRPPIIVITAHGELSTAVEAIRQGAFDYLAKPFELDVARRVIERALQMPMAEASPEAESTNEDGEDTLIGAAPAMQEVFKNIALAAVSDACVHIYGESGAGKELVARAIHRNSRRADRPFVPIHVAALSPSLAESELFGHVRGAFTGADADRRGLLETADGGTVFLDEIADIPLPLQVKLLRSLDRGEIFPVGASRPIRSDFRLISAANQSLSECVAEDRFRHDLFYRLTAFTIDLPPLRDRMDDIPMLVRHFLRQVARRQGIATPAVSDEGIRTLMERPWRGNVRELRNAVEHAVVMARSGGILPEHFPEPTDLFDEEASDASPELQEAVRRWIERRLASDDAPEELYTAFLEEVEPPLLAALLEQTDGNYTAAAQLLGLHRSTFRKKCQQHGLSHEG